MHNQIEMRNDTRKVGQMLILQILIVPIFALILLGVVFIIGVAVVTPSRYDNQDDLPANPAEK